MGERAQSAAVLGCADGRFVFGFARAGLAVTAIDIDPTALIGGMKIFPDGEREIPGLKWRAGREGLSSRVTVIEGDYVTTPIGQHDAVFTSGSIHYSHNTAYSIENVVRSVKNAANIGGLIYIDYMLPCEARHRERSNYLRRGQIETILQGLACTVIFSRYSGIFVERAHVEQPQDHTHSLGYVLARRCGS